jgi:predicted RNA-binding Zn ribbon-like protein
MYRDCYDSVVIPVDPLPIEIVVDLVNEYANETRRVARESADPYATLEAIEPFDIDLSERVALADELHGVFAGPASAPDRLNRLVDDLGLEHRLASDGRLVWMHPGAGSALAASAVAALVDFISGGGTGRVGICDADGCVDVFVDTSPAATRSYCSPQCHSRARVARWRAARRRDATSGPSGETAASDIAGVRRGSSPSPA